MFTILIIIAAILLVVLLAYLIVNKIPKKLRPVISILLWLLIIFLGYQIFLSIMGPIKFNKEKKIRYAKVIESLKIIRDAEVAHKEVKGRFTNKATDLIHFIDTDSFAITKIENIVVTEQRGTISVEVEKRVVDTIRFDPVRAKFAGRDYKNMFNVPGTDAQFGLETGFVEKIQGVKAPVFLAKVAKEIVLKGMSKSLINQEKESLGGPEIRGEFVSVGSLEDVKTGGNWPPFYDTDEDKDK